MITILRRPVMCKLLSVHFEYPCRCLICGPLLTLQASSPQVSFIVNSFSIQMLNDIIGTFLSILVRLEAVSVLMVLASWLLSRASEFSLPIHLSTSCVSYFDS